ncbi:hypothetical protein PG990_007698 [Apiospora arundinis]
MRLNHDRQEALTYLPEYLPCLPCSHSVRRTSRPPKLVLEKLLERPYVGRRRRHAVHRREPPREAALTQLLERAGVIVAEDGELGHLVKHPSGPSQVLIGVAAEDGHPVSSGDNLLEFAPLGLLGRGLLPPRFVSGPLARLARDAHPLIRDQLRGVQRHVPMLKSEPSTLLGLRKVVASVSMRRPSREAQIGGRRGAAEKPKGGSGERGGTESRRCDLHSSCDIRNSVAPSNLCPHRHPL